MRRKIFMFVMAFIMAVTVITPFAGEDVSAASRPISVKVNTYYKYYTGGNLYPSYVVSYKGKKLSNKCYTVVYRRKNGGSKTVIPKEPGDYSVYVTGKNGHDGKVVFTFTIRKTKKISRIVLKKSSFPYGTRFSSAAGPIAKVIDTNGNTVPSKYYYVYGPLNPKVGKNTVTVRPVANTMYNPGPSGSFTKDYKATYTVKAAPKTKIIYAHRTFKISSLLLKKSLVGKYKAQAIGIKGATSYQFQFKGKVGKTQINKTVTTKYVLASYTTPKITVGKKWSEKMYVRARVKYNGVWCPWSGWKRY